jgi:Mrp family chromosome partitioning ATPase
MRHAEQHGMRVIGIAGMQAGVGASTLARRLARAYTDFGNATLLVDASAAGTGGTTSEPGPAAPSHFMDLARDEQSLWVLDLAEHADRLPATHHAMRQMFDTGAKDMIVVVDLPPVNSATGAFRSGFYSGAATACDLVYLVCLSGVTRKSALANCVEICRINGLKIGGIVANDWKLLGAGYLPTRSETYPKSAMD